MKIHLKWTFLLLLLSNLPLQAGESAETPGNGVAPSVDSLVAEALLKNASLNASRHRQAAAWAESHREGALAPPEIAAETGRRTVFSHAGEMSMPVSGLVVRQMLMFPGKLSAMETAGRHQAAALGWNTRTEADRLTLQVRTLYYELYMLQSKSGINAENRRVMEKFVSVARTQYEAGMGRMEDILRAQTELSRLRSEDVILSRKYRGMESMLNAALDRPPGKVLGTIADPENARLPLPVADSLEALALALRPELKAMASEVQMSQWEWTAAKRGWYPDFMVEGKWMRMDGPDEWSAMAGITMPLAPWSSGGYRGARDAAERGWKEMREREREMKNMVRAEIHRAVADVEAARERFDLALGATVPQAEQTLRATEASYRAGKTEFLMLLDAYRMLYMAQEDLYMARAELAVGWAALERSVGLPRDQILARFARIGQGAPSEGGTR